MGTHPIFESDFDCLTEMNSRMIGKSILSATRFSARPTISKIHLSRRTVFGFGKKNNSQEKCEDPNENVELTKILEELSKLSEEELQIRLDLENEKKNILLENLEKSQENYNLAKDKRDLADDENKQNKRRVNLEYEKTKVFGAKKKKKFFGEKKKKKKKKKK